jgi:sugar phosphate isomerase/epimerase
MKLAVVTSTPEVQVQIPVALLAGTFVERLQKAAQLGYDGVELMIVRPDELDVEEIRAQLSKHRLQVAAVASGGIGFMDKLTLLAADAEVSRRAIERLHALVDIAAQLHAPIVTLGGFRGRLAWAGGPAARARLIEILRAASDRAAEQGVRLALEPLNRYESDVVNTADEGLKLIEEVDRRQLGLLFDTFHMNIEESSFHTSLRQVMSAGRLWHIHLGDSNRLPPGQGHIDFAGIVSTLSDIGYQGYLSAELRPLPDPDAAAAATIQHIRQFVPINH